MTQRISTLFLLFAFALLGACASVPTDDIQVDANADPKVNLSAYHSYAWIGSGGILHDPAGIWKPVGFDVDAEIRKLISAELDKHGLEPGQSPDLLVGFVVGVDMAALELKEDPETQLQVLDNVPKGALVVVLVDARTRMPVWAGAATANIRAQGDDDSARKRLAYAIRKMFEKFPR